MSTLLLAGTLSLSACAPPRGAALSSEILQAQNDSDATYQVVPVSRANLATLRGWPATGGSGRHSWLTARQGPETPVIRSGDHISLVIWDSQENSLLAAQSEKSVTIPDLVVSSDGAIFVPYLDRMMIGGKTPDEARDQIQQALTPIVPSAQVQLAVVAGRQNSVDLVSGVAKPGSYPLPDRNYSILSLLANGGGIDPDMRNPVVRLIRGNNRYEIPAEKLFANPAYNALLLGGDQVVVEPDRRYFTALGATGTQSLIRFDKDEISALETLSMIGGLAPARADPRGVLVLREYPATALRADGTGPKWSAVIFTFDLTSADGLFAARGFQILPEDTVMVTEAPLVNTRNVLGLIGTALGVANSVSN